MEVRLTAVSLYYNPEMDTLDIWLADPSTESGGEPLTDNIVTKSNGRGEIIGFEILQLRMVNSEDMNKLPEQVRTILLESANRFSILKDSVSSADHNR